MPIFSHPTGFGIINRKNGFPHLLPGNPFSTEPYATGLISPEWDSWFVKVRDHANKGENPSDTQNIEAATGINLTSDVTNLIIRIQSGETGPINITKNPQISKGFDGQVITIEGQDNTKTVTLDDGDGLVLAGGTSFTIGEHDIIRFHFNEIKNLWIEHYRSNN